jgi:hypothetical protein
MPTSPRDNPDADNEERDFDTEFETFMLQHDLEVAVQEVYHLNPGQEETGDVRQHNHVVLRSTHRKNAPALSVCMTSRNWDAFPVLPPHVLLSLAVDASMLEECERVFLHWAEVLELDADSRSVERKFRQTVQMSDALREILGQRAYKTLLELGFDLKQSWLAVEEESGDEDEDEWES